MRLFTLELKRVLKTKWTWILLGLALLLCVMLAYLPVTFVYCSHVDEQGNTAESRGLEAIRCLKELQKDYTGTVTPEKVRSAVEQYQACMTEYDVQDSYELPDGVYTEKILPYVPLIHGVKEAYADPVSGMAAAILELSPEKAADLYAASSQRVASLMKMEQENHPEAQKKAEAMYQEVKTPFTWYSGSSSDAMDYQTMLIFLIGLLCAVIAAPVFSTDYQTQADDILRSTKYGRRHLSITKIVSALVICGACFFVCALLYLVISNSLFGWESTKTSIQMMYSVSSLPAFNMGQLQWFIVMGSFVSFLSTISVTLFLSAKCRSTTASLAISLFVCILPVIIYLAVPGELGVWIRCLLPSGGIGLQSSYLYAVTDFDFLNMGKLAVWTPYAMLAAAAIEIPVFLGLTVHAYSRRTAS